MESTGQNAFPSEIFSKAGREYSEDVKIAMLRAEAQEYGLIPDDAAADLLEIPADILDE